MIMVQIDVPVVFDNIDFSLDENCDIATVKGEIVQVLHRKYGDNIELKDNIHDYRLYIKDQELMLSDDDCLNSHGVTDGSVLLLV